MTDNSPGLIADLEARIEELEDERRRVLKAVLLSRVAMWAGVAAVILAVSGTILVNRVETGVAGLAAVLGGLVFGGSSRATAGQLGVELARLEDERRRAIDALEFAFTTSAPSRAVH